MYDPFLCCPFCVNLSWDQCPFHSSSFPSFYDSGHCCVCCILSYYCYYQLIFPISSIEYIFFLFPIFVFVSILLFVMCLSLHYFFVGILEFICFPLSLFSMYLCGVCFLVSNSVLVLMLRYPFSAFSLLSLQSPPHVYLPSPNLELSQYKIQNLKFFKFKGCSILNFLV